jgi:hypothetical protein
MVISSMDKNKAVKRRRNAILNKVIKEGLTKR